MTNDDLKWNNLIDLLQFRAEKQPQQKAFIYLDNNENEENILTYLELNQRAKAIGGKLQELIATKNERVLLLFPPGTEFIEAFFGCLFAGMIPIPLFHPRNRRYQEKIELIANKTKAKFIITDSKTMIKVGKRPLEITALDNAFWFNSDNISTELAKNWQKPNIRKDDIAFLQFTSGSTSEPKGIIATHNTVLCNSEMIKCGLNYSNHTIMVSWAPHYHDLGLIGNIIQPIYTGFINIMISPYKFIQDPLFWLKVITKYKATTTGGPNFGFDLCADKFTNKNDLKIDLSSLKTVYNGSEPIRGKTIDNFIKAFSSVGFDKKSIYTTYGLAEAMLFVTGGYYRKESVCYLDSRLLLNNIIKPVPLKNKNAKTIVGVGKPNSYQLIKIVCPNTHKELTNNTIGEIWIQGPSISPGYWESSAQTNGYFNAKIIKQQGEYLRTGDLGFLREDNELFITGRLKDLIIIRGQNYYPQDIEHVVESSHRAIVPYGVAAFSIENDKEEELIIVSEIKRSFIKSSNLVDVAKSVTSTLYDEYELIPKEVILIKAASLPKTSSGKTQRNLCKKAYLESVLEQICIFSVDDFLLDGNTVSEYNAPENLIIEKLIQIFKEVLKIEEIIPNKPYYYYSGNSLTTAQLVTQIEDIFDITLPLNYLSSSLTIYKLSNIIKELQLDKELLSYGEELDNYLENIKA